MNKQTKMTDHLDIVALIEKNPLTRFSKDYNSKFIEKIQSNFTELQQQLFVSSFYCYLNYDSKTDFVIDLDDIWKWLGFSRKEFCKKALEKNFVKDIDFKVALLQLEKRKNEGGHNKETITLTINTFKKLCLKANTKKADEIHDYFLKLEETFQDIVNEETDELRNQLMDKQKELNRERALRNKMLNRKWYDSESGDCVYVFVDNVNDPNSLIKIGKSKHIMDREAAYSNANKSGSIEYVKRCNDCSLTEKVCHHILDKYRENKLQEFFQVPLELAIKTINDVVAFLDTHENEDSQTNTSKVTELEVKNADTSKENPKSSSDIASFVRDCCDVRADFFIPKENLKNAYRLWARSVDPTYKKKLVEYCESTFKTSKIYIENQRRQCYKGLNLKPLTDLVNVNGTLDYQVFIRDKCVIDWNNRLSYCDFFEEYIKWKQDTDATFELDYDTKRKIQKYLDTTFYGGRVHLSNSTSATHLFGIWGLGLQKNGVNEDSQTIGLKTRKRTTKAVHQIDVSTGKIMETWESITEASKSIDIPISTLSNYIRFGSKRNVQNVNDNTIEVQYIFSS